jgi:UDP-N-acetylglucosamine 2-epimerase (non-hydrolysing)
VRLIERHRLLDDKPHVKLHGPCGFLEYLDLQYQACGVISDSGTSQEECPLLGVPVAVPRDFTERPESVEFGNSVLVGETRPIEEMTQKTLRFFEDYRMSEDRLKWLGDGRTAERIVDVLERELAR